MRLGLFPVVAIAFGTMLSGCRLPGSEGPVSRSLAASRQFCQQGVAAMEGEQWQQAEALLAKAVQACPSDPDARRQYAQALWHRGGRRSAVAQLEEAAQLAGEDATLHVLIAEMRLAMGEIPSARQSAQQALSLDPKLSTAWATRGRVMRAAGELRQALADYHRALGLAPDDRTLPLEIAELYRQLNRPQRALATLDGLADTYPPGGEPQRVLFLQGLAYAALERYEDAVESFSAASIRDRPTPEILYQLGEAELLAGYPAEAAAAAREAIGLDPEHRPSHDLLGRIRLALEPGGPLNR